MQFLFSELFSFHNEFYVQKGKFHQRGREEKKRGIQIRVEARLEEFRGFMTPPQSSRALILIWLKR